MLCAAAVSAGEAKVVVAEPPAEVAEPTAQVSAQAETVELALAERVQPAELSVPETVDGLAADGLAADPRLLTKQIIGTTATIAEMQSELSFVARVDTGARACSLHIDEVVVDEESESMHENIGKEIRLKLRTKRGETSWVTTTIEECRLVRCADSEEYRYAVPLDLNWNGMIKTVLVTLNDRSQMAYRLLLGRNFLAGDFLVEIGSDEG